MNPLRKFVNLSLFLCLSLFAAAQGTPVSLAPIPQFQAFDANGKPLAFGCVFTYVARTTTQLATFSDYTGTIQNSNPVILSASGSANIWIQAGQVYTFVVKSAGGTNCSLGTLMYSVDGIGGGSTQTVTPVPSGTTPSFTVISQFQVFTMTLTADTVALPVSFVNVTAPALITFQLTQDAFGGHAFTWPTNVTGGVAIDSTANHTTSQTFVWNGTSILPVGAGFTSAGTGSLEPTIINPSTTFNGSVATQALSALNLTLSTGVSPSIQSSGNGTQLTLQAANATSGNTNGGTYSVGSGNGSGTGNGGNISLSAGSSGTTGNGGAVTVTAGNGTGGGKAGGSIVLTPGGGSGGASAGDVQIASGGLELPSAGVNKLNGVSTAGHGIPAVFASLDLTAQGADIPTTTLLTANANSSEFYRISCEVILTRVATTSSTIPLCIVRWTDPDNNTLQSLQLTATFARNLNNLTTIDLGTIWVAVKAGTNITYETSGYATSGATSMQFAVHLRADAL